MDVTISLLPASLALVHIPRSRLPHLCHPILRQILQPSPPFLNITCNEIELSIFADHLILEDFEPIARRDRQRQRSRSGSNSRRKQSSASSGAEPIEMSYERWSVLQIDSHSDSLDNSGSRVHELSAPLAAAGISILYQSSYTSDFILVKESRLQETMSLLESAGFGPHSHDSNILTSSVSAPLSPISLGSSSDIISQLELFSRRESASEAPEPPNHDRTQLDSGSASDEPHPSTTSRKNSQSPSPGEVYVLPSDLACVGLSDDHVDRWALKIVKLVAFPDLIEYDADHATGTKFALPLNLSAYPVPEPPHPLPRGRSSFSSSVSTSSTSSEEGYFSHSPAANHSSSSLVTSAASRSCTDLPTPTTVTSSTRMSSSKHRLIPTAVRVLGEAHDLTDSSFFPRPQRANRGMRSAPFFSFTRTAEGSSLTTDVSLLSALFPPHERYMVSCSTELDAADDRDASAVQLTPDDDEDDENNVGPGSTLRCLQIDLRRFGLDKHGLVSKFSRVLNENGINHMYSSTFKTANLLVDKRHALRAQSLLRAC